MSRRTPRSADVIEIEDSPEVIDVSDDSPRPPHQPQVFDVIDDSPLHPTHSPSPQPPYVPSPQPPYVPSPQPPYAPSPQPPYAPSPQPPYAPSPQPPYAPSPQPPYAPSPQPPYVPPQPPSPELPYVPPMSPPRFGPYEPPRSPVGPGESDDSELRESDSEATRTRKVAKNRRHKNRPTRLARYRAEFQTRAARMRSNPTIARIRAGFDRLHTRHGKKSKFENYILRTFFCLGTRFGNECQVIGSRSEYAFINQYFGNFSLTRTPNYLQEVRTHSKVSNNGFVKLLLFSKGGFNANATLKCNQRSSADNLLYEYRVGLFINSIMHRFPCFVRTYGVYRVSQPGYEHLKNSSAQGAASSSAQIRLNPTPDELRDMLEEFPDHHVTHGCRNPKYIVLVTQFFMNCTSLHNFMYSASRNAPELIRTNLLQILYQIYYPLSQLRTSFTHYDLHTDNILLYPVPLVNGRPGHILFNYPGVQFRCQYIVKIIDYGRCYYSFPGGSSEQDYQHIHDDSKQCPHDGRDLGFSNMHIPHYWNGISADRKNETHDLRVLDNVLWDIYKTENGARTGNNNARWEQLKALSMPFHHQLFILSRNLQYMNSANGKDDPSKKDIKKNIQKPGWGAPERLVCTADKPVCNVQSAEARLRTEVGLFMERVNNETERTLSRTNLFNPNPRRGNEGIENTKYATIVCDGVSAVKFIKH